MSRLSMRNDKDPAKRLLSYKFKVAKPERPSGKLQGTKPKPERLQGTLKPKTRFVAMADRIFDGMLAVETVTADEIDSVARVLQSFDGTHRLLHTVMKHLEDAAKVQGKVGVLVLAERYSAAYDRDKRPLRPLAEEQTELIGHQQRLSKALKNAPWKELTQEMLNKATRIYFKHAWGRAPTDSELYDMGLQEVLRQIKDGHCGYTFSCRFGCQNSCAGNMKLEIAYSTLYSGGFVFYVHENDDGCLEQFHKKNLETVRKIEKEWARNGIPVHPPRKK